MLEHIFKKILKTTSCLILFSSLLWSPRLFATVHATNGDAQAAFVPRDPTKMDGGLPNHVQPVAEFSAGAANTPILYDCPDCHRSEVGLQQNTTATTEAGSKSPGVAK